MKPRSVRLREDANQAALRGAMFLMLGIACAVFAHVCRLHELFWPMMALACSALGLFCASIARFSDMHAKYRAAEREAYWEHRRFMDQFNHVHRI